MKALQNPRRVHVKAGHGHLFSMVQQCSRQYVLRNSPLLSFQDSHLGGRHDPFPVTSEHKRAVQKSPFGFQQHSEHKFLSFLFFFLSLRPLLWIFFVLAPVEQEAEGVGRPEIRHKSSRGALHVRSVRWSPPLLLWTSEQMKVLSCS